MRWAQRETTQASLGWDGQGSLPGAGNIGTGLCRLLGRLAAREKVELNF